MNIINYRINFQSTGACKSDSDCNTKNCQYCTSEGICREYHEGYCDTFQCGLGDGNCLNDGDCASGLICGKNISIIHPKLSGCGSEKLGEAGVCIEPGT